MLKTTLSLALLVAGVSAQAGTWHASTRWTKPTSYALPAGALASTELDCKDGLTGSHIAGYSAAELKGFSAVTKAAGISTGVESVGWLSTGAKCDSLEASLASAKSLSLQQSFYRNVLSSDSVCELYVEESLKVVNEKGETLLSGLAETTSRVSAAVCAKVPKSKRQAL